MEQINLKKIPIYILSRKYYVPESSTIITAMEYAGFKLKKGVGCREGFCGACATIYRLPGDYKLHGGLGCQTVVQENMQIVQIPYVPNPKAIYDLEQLEPDPQVFLEYYPETFKCLSCNTCTKICPQDIQVMDYVQAVVRGDIEKVSELSFDCLSCGLCAARCPAEITQFNVALLARRIYGKYLSKKGKFVETRIKEIEEGKYEEGYKELANMPLEDLKKKYFERDLNFDIT
ncbi:MAG: 4Fe-4S dicluster domain-containing protein [Caldisericia bacterium]|jgi:heterodisulfide reductase subunit C|nr:4Fe-4S dicluster domain-containing protein [Caldisericia bacterium]HOW03053.1 4Fe-4S dicluster domain-containing protein [Caldisericia bacterium]